MQVTGPYSIAGGTTLALPLPSAVTSWQTLVLANQSALLVAVQYNGTRWLQPWTSDSFDVSGGPYITVTPQGSGSGTLTAEWYGPSDPAPSGYPAPLTNQAPSQVSVYSPVPVRSSSATTSATVGANPNFTVTIGIGANAGDLAVVVFSTNSAPSALSTPSGWAVLSVNWLMVAYKVLAAADVGSSVGFHATASAGQWDIDVVTIDNAVIGNTGLGGLQTKTASILANGTQTMSSPAPVASFALAIANGATSAPVATDALAIYASPSGGLVTLWRSVSLKLVAVGATPSFAMTWGTQSDSRSGLVLLAAPQ